MSAGAITLGRNIGARPMPQAVWARFVADIEGLVRQHGGALYTTAYGAGRWNDIPEETAVITFDRADTMILARALPRYAAVYGQDTIALLVGETVLAEAATGAAHLVDARGGSHEYHNENGR